MRAVHWFRKGLRLHDNPALVEAVRQCGASSSPADACVYAVFVLDPWFVEEGGVGANRWRFLLESLADLHAQLEAAGSKLFVLQGRPEEVLPAFFAEQRVTLLTFEVDTEPYAVKRDSAIVELAAEAGIATEMRTSHTLFEPERLLARNQGKLPGSYATFCKLAGKSAVPPPVGSPLGGAAGASSSSSSSSASASAAAAASAAGEGKADEPPFPSAGVAEAWAAGKHGVPSLADLGVDPASEGAVAEAKFPGGEREALRRMRSYLARPAWIRAFEKPKTSPNTLEASTTVLSPYLKFGCLSPRLFYHELSTVYAAGNGQHTKPPVSLHGQLLWREFYYVHGHHLGEAYGRMQGNSLCRQIPWAKNDAHLAAWTEGRTGYVPLYTRRCRRWFAA